MVSEIDRLGALQMGVAGHRPIAVLLGELEQASHQRRRQLERALGPRAHVQGEIGGDLVVSRAPGVKLAAERADDLRETALDRHVNVLVVVVEAELVTFQLPGDLRETVVDLRRFLGAEDAGVFERPHMRPRAAHVLAPEPSIEADRGIDPREQWIRWLFEAGHGGGGL